MLFCEVNHVNSIDDRSNYDIDACCSMVEFAESYCYNRLEMKGNLKILHMVIYITRLTQYIEN